MRFIKKKSIRKKSTNKIITGIVFVLFLGIFSSYAQQISKNAIGLRLGDSDGFGAEISYQHKLSNTNRLELDLGFRNNKNFDVWKLSGIYQWVWNIDGNFNWYAGFGATAGNSNVKKAYTGTNRNNGFFASAAGNVGVEYDFDIPLLVSLDFRPEIGVINKFGKNDLGLDIALSFRYQF